MPNKTSDGYQNFCSAENFHRECDNFAPICGTLWQRDRSKTRRDRWLFCVWGYAISRLSLVTKGRVPEIVTDFWVWMARRVCVAVLLLLFQLALSRKISIGKQAAHREIERGSGRSNAIYINALAQKLAKATVNWNSVSGLCHMSLIQLIKPIVCISGLASLSLEGLTNVVWWSLNRWVKLLQNCTNIVALQAFPRFPHQMSLLNFSATITIYPL